MTKRTIVVRKQQCSWQPKTKRKQVSQAAPKAKHNAGFINPVFVVAIFGFLAGLFYLYSINQSAVRGFQIKQVEKEIAQIEKSNEKLKIKEAELKSLYHIEESSKQLNMSALGTVNYIDEGETMALGKTSTLKK